MRDFADVVRDGQGLPYRRRLVISAVGGVIERCGDRRGGIVAGGGDGQRIAEAVVSVIDRDLI